MSRRVYEVARELGLSTKEVMGRLNDAGVEAKSNLSVVDDTTYERVFGNGPRSNGSGGVAPDASLEMRGAGASPRWDQNSRSRARKRSHARRTLAYVLVAFLAFAVAAGAGAVVALMLGGDPGPLGQREPGPSEQRVDADAGQEEGASQGDGAVPRLGEAEYIARVGDMQGEAVETFMDSHDKLLRYDALTAEDIDKMRANEAALEEMAREAVRLAPPRAYEEQHEAFGSAVAELHEAARMAYELANDPVAAAEIGFDRYDARVNEVEGLLERSNEMLGRDFETIGDPREISPQLSATEPARG